MFKTLIGALALLVCVDAYLPGVAPREYALNDVVELKVNKIDSIKTQVPYRYYDLPFCRPSVIREAAENLGEILVGDRIENSVFDILARKDVECQQACKMELNADDIKLFRKRIDEEYLIHWSIDNLPAATKRFVQITKEHGEIPIYEPGFPIGELGKNVIGAQKDAVYLNNHYVMTIKYHSEPEYEDKGVRIVGFEVVPQSVHYSTDGASGPGACPAKQSGGVVVAGDKLSVPFTYSIKWVRSDHKWATRWDIYLNPPSEDKQIHWFSIINSVMILVFLTGMVAIIMMKTVSADFRMYRELETQEEAQEETGWKLVHGDVFRQPRHEMFLAVLVGNGSQVLVMSVVVLVFALLGFLSPANRGALLSSSLVFFVLCGVISGYVSARFYKFMKGTQWKKNTMMTALLLPGICFSIFFVLNIVLKTQGSSAAVGFVTLLVILLLWIGVALPLTFFGSYFGYRRDVIDPPCRVNQIPRQVPPTVWYMNSWVSALMGGILPFGAIFIELFFILSSIWLHQFYYLFSFLFLVFVILFATCAEIVIVMAYFQLCAEDYHWWWRSFFTSGSSALYMFCYSIVYFYTKLTIKQAASTILYFGYTIILSLVFFLLTGTVGFFSCYFFVMKIYSVIKSD